MTAHADWFLDAPKVRRIQAIMADPSQRARKIHESLPREAIASLIAFSEFGLSGCITLTFNHGSAGGCKVETRHAISCTPQVEDVPA